VVQVHLGPPELDDRGCILVRSIRLGTSPTPWMGLIVKKLLLVVLLAGIGYVVYRQISANKAEQDLWSEATSEPDLR
jgi:hypothetical protein